MAKKMKWEWYPAQFEKQLHRGEGTQRVINRVAGEIADDAAAGSHRNNPKYDVEGYQETKEASVSLAHSLTDCNRSSLYFNTEMIQFRLNWKYQAAHASIRRCPSSTNAWTRATRFSS